MHRDTTELLAYDLTLSGVDARANVDAQLPDRVHDRPSAANRTRRTVKGRQEAVASSIDLATSMPRELVANKEVMLSEQIFPFSITEFDKSLRRLDYVRE
jgi:hypothetical protein